MDKTLQQIQQFHGHLGPYVVIGYKMGKIANQHLGAQPFSKQAIIWTGTIPPISCIIDGIQLSSGCTLGTGKVIIKQDGIPKVTFTDNHGKTINIILKSHVQKEIDTSVTEENIITYSEQLYKKSDNELFEILV